jgi:superfamily I DNA/RNA helicase
MLMTNNLWDDADRVMDLLLRSEARRDDSEMNYTGKGGPYNKIYVDEIQDSTQAEITLLFLCCGYDFDALFLAGDNAQSVVEGVDFRFEEVRWVGGVMLLVEGEA